MLETDSAVDSTSALSSLRFFGDYELLEQIAQGGMGVVFKARHVTLNRLVALKLISGGLLASRSSVRRFQAEAEAIAGLNHPNIVALHEFGEVDGQHYFSMALIEGPNLGEFLERKPLPPEHAARLMIPLARAVHYAHQRGVLHRDLKPANVLIDAHGQPHLTDFSLAKFIERDSTLTHTNAMLGTPAYMSPEQARGDAQSVTTATDVYGLGAVLYEMITGFPPFAGGVSFETVRQVLEEEPRRPSAFIRSVDRDLETICLKCLEKDPARRYGSAEALADDLERWLRDEPIHARPTGLLTRMIKWTRRKPALAAAFAVLATLLLVVAIGAPIALFRIERERYRAERNHYAGNMVLAFKNLEIHNLGRVRNLLEQHLPERNRGRDLRGWEWRYLWTQLRSDEIGSLPENRYEIQCFAFSDNGRYLAVGEGRGAIAIWDMWTTQEVARADGPIVPTVIRFSPDGRHLVSAHFEHGLLLWDWHPPRLSRRPAPLIEAGIVNAIHIDKGIVSVVDQRRRLLRRWNIGTGRELPGFPVTTSDPDTVAGSAFSRDGRLLATCSNGAVFLWDCETGAKLAEWKRDAPDFLPLKFSPDSSLLVATHSAGVCEVLNTRTFETVTSFRAHESDVGDGGFSPDGALFATAGFDHTLRIWKVADWKEKSAVQPIVLRGHLGELYGAAYSPSGDYIATGGADGFVKFWRPTGKPPHEPILSRPLPPDTEYWSLDPDGRHLLLLFPDNTAVTWDLDSWSETEKRAWPLSGVRCAALLTGAGSAAIGTDDGRVALVDFATMQAQEMATRLSSRVSKISVSAQGNTVVAQSTDGRLKAWETAAGREIADIAAEHKAFLDRIPVSPDGSMIMTASLDGTSDFWHLPTDTKRTIRQDKLSTTGAAFFRDGRVATSSTDKTARIWNLNTLQTERTLYSDQNGLRSIALSPDEKRLAAGDDLGNPRKVKVWDVELGQEVALLAGHKTAITDVAFWPDNNTLVSVSRDAVFLWRARSLADIDAERARR